MKKFLVFAIIFLAFNLNAQEKLTSYKCNLSTTPFDILVNDKSNGSYSILIKMHTSDKINKNGGINIDSEIHLEFIDKLNKAKLKYSEWVKVAKENKVKEFIKEMDFTVSTSSAHFFIKDQIHLQLNVDLKCRFIVVDELMSLFISTGTLKSFLQKDISHDGFKFVFTSEKEISDFIDKISVQKVKDFIKKPKTSDLFKN